MRILLTTVFGAGLTLTSQAQVVAIQHAAPVASPSALKPVAPAASPLKRHNVVSMPMLGLLAGPGNTDVRQILGPAANPSLGELLPMPPTAARIYLAPRQFYALVEQQQDEPLTVWEPWTPRAAAPDSLLPIGGKNVFRRPDLVAFSPQGKAAILYSGAAAELQILEGLPRSAALKYHIAASPIGVLKRIAVSDDGVVAVAETVTGELYASASSGAWRIIPGITARGWLFLPNSRDLLIADSARNSILLARAVDAPSSSAPDLIASGMQPDRLAVTKDGETAAAFDSSKGQLSLIALRTGVVTPIAPDHTPETLVALRDGHTFLLSASPAVSVLQTASSPAVSAAQFASGINR